MSKFIIRDAKNYGNMASPLFLIFASRCSQFSKYASVPHRPLWWRLIAPPHSLLHILQSGISNFALKISQYGPNAPVFTSSNSPSLMVDTIHLPTSSPLHWSWGTPVSLLVSSSLEYIIKLFDHTLAFLINMFTDMFLWNFGTGVWVLKRYG